MCTLIGAYKCMHASIINVKYNNNNSNASSTRIMCPFELSVCALGCALPGFADSARWSHLPLLIFLSYSPTRFARRTLCIAYLILTWIFFCFWRTFALHSRNIFLVFLRCSCMPQGAQMALHVDLSVIYCNPQNILAIAFRCFSFRDNIFINFYAALAVWGVAARFG